MHPNLSQPEETVTALLQSQSCLDWQCDGRLRQLVDSLPVLISYIDKNLCYQFANKAYERWFGLETRNIIGQSMVAVLGQAAVDALSPYLDRVLAGEAVSFEMLAPYKEGGHRYIKVNYLPQFDTDNRLDGFCVLVEDVSPKYKAEEAFLKSQEGYQLILEGANDGVWDWDIPNGIVYTNQRYQEQMGVEDKFKVELFWESLHPDDRDLVSQALDRHFHHSQPFQCEFRIRNLKTGEYIPVLSRGKAILNADGLPIRMAGTHTDLNERVTVQHALKQSEERLRLLADAVPSFVWTVTLDGNATSFNARWYRYTGLTEQMSLNQGWTQAIHPDDLDTCLIEWEKARQQGTFYEFEVRYKRHDGEYRWYLAQAEPIQDSEGQISTWFGVSTDIHDRKLAEQAMLDYQTRLEASNRELEQFATVASHDLQEPLRKVMLFSQFIRDDLGNVLTEKSLNYMERVQGATQRMQDMITGLLDLSRVNPKGKPFQRTNLNAVIQNVISDLHVAIEETRGQVVVNELMTIDADAHQMGQLFQNLISNALKFHKPDESPIVTIEAARIDRELCEIRVQDNGIGFDEKYLDRVFGIFERLHGRHSEYPGTGIGLAICQKIVDRHHGNITAISQPGLGATFIITLPVRQCESAPLPA